MAKPPTIIDNNTVSDSLPLAANHTMLLKALKAVDLEEILNESGPFTVFAPSDTAFLQLSDESLKTLFKEENKAKLRSLLTLHMVAGELTASKMMLAMCRGEGKATFTTVHGKKITATMSGTDIILTDSEGNSARIIAADGEGQGKGVIHEIDSVFMPTRS